MSNSDPELLRSVGGVSAVTLLSRLTGQIRDAVIAALLGTSAAGDSFNIAFMLPNLFRRLVGEGAMSAAFIPVLMGVRERRGEPHSRRFANLFFFWLLACLALIVALGIALAPFLLAAYRGSFPQQAAHDDLGLTANLTRLMFPYLLFVSLSAFGQAILNAHGSFALPAFTPILLNLSVVGFGWGARSWFSNPSYALAVAVVIGGILQFAWQLPPLWRLGYQVGWPGSWRDPDVLEVGRLMLPGTVGAGVYQINILLSTALAWRLAEGSVLSLTASNRLVELVLGVFAVALATVLLPTLSRRAAAGDREGMRSILGENLRTIAFIAIPASFGLILLAEPIVGAVYQWGAFDASSTRRTAAALVAQAIGLTFIASYRVLVQGFYSLRDTRTPVLAAALAVAINLTGCLLLPGLFAPELAHAGIALATSIASIVHFTLLYLLLRARLGGMIGPAGWLAYARIALAALIMAAAVGGAEQLFGLAPELAKSALALRLGAVIAIGLAILLAAGAVLRIPEQRRILSTLRRADPART
ncbi:MAG TPA: murein biosynthesis integral membrane protein MurJ [Acidobacteriota bacterium]